MKALLIVDVQNDFCPGGALPAADGDKIVPLVNSLMHKFPLIVASKDCHPKETVHFDIWPPHCIYGTSGADFYPDLMTEKIDKVFLKGTRNIDNGYSSFEATNDDLSAYLKNKGVDLLYICGLTTEYCVKTTALDAIKNGFKTFVIQDAIKPVAQNIGDEEKALNEMIQAGVKLINSSGIL